MTWRTRSTPATSMAATEKPSAAALGVLSQRRSSMAARTVPHLASLALIFRTIEILFPP